jgi:transcriptional regulator with XRE-family HTH domain
MSSALPWWATRLREERIMRLWSQKDMAVRLRRAADEQLMAALPSVESLRRYVRAYEAGKHFPGDLYAELYCRALGLPRDDLFGPPSAPAETMRSCRIPTEHDAWSLTSWINATNVGVGALDNFAETTFQLCETHTRTPPGSLLTDVIRTHQQVQRLLQSGKQQLRQTKELYRIDSDLLAHAALLLGDLDLLAPANAFGAAALLCAREAEASEAVALSVQAKTKRWMLRFSEAADLARRGFDCSPPTQIRVLLASQEANAAALLGDVARAAEALSRAEIAADTAVAIDSGVAAWSCPRPRQALFALSVAIRLGDPDAALRAAATADSAWSAGDPWAAGVWAQVRLAAGIARVMNGDLGGAQDEVTPVFSLAPEFRISTITGYASDMQRRLQRRCFQHDPLAAEIREQIHDFNAAALRVHAAPKEDR